VAVANLVRSRRRAEQDRRTIAALYERLDEQYGEQRGIALTLQSALLPAFNPDIPELEIASRYIAGAVGVDIGGDWYSMIRLDGDHVAFVVGDVSGRGISAATAMARLRFTIRAYLAEGHGPATVLDMCSRQFDISDDGHFATVLVGVVNLRARTVVLANAGHFAPLILSGDDRHYAATDPSPPLGTGVRAHTATTFTMPEGSTLLAFTDGLIERRTESLDVGLGRLAAMTWDDQRSVDDLLEHVVADHADGPEEDDIALLAFRWRPLPDTHAPEHRSGEDLT
jgi:serine phosphatase RsbU (regulator of sigma subunit)